MKNPSRTGLFVRVLVFSLIFIVLGRVSTQFTSVAATDVAFPDWVPFVFSLVSELIVCARIVIGYAGMAHGAYFTRHDDGGRVKSALPGMTVLVLVLSFADYLARFVIDFASGSITGAEGVALIWLGLQFVYEGIFIVLSMLIITVQRSKHDLAETSRARARHTPHAAVRYCVILTLVSRVVLEIASIIEFVTTYTGITSAETASMIGSVIKIIVIYGGGALILGEVFTDFLAAKQDDAG
ncbi:MAG: hypothetical protein IJ037_12710 [Clostridia bacterium]|nr:hypothetical protein [Clostridia bacterium]MBQ8368398.1 hypothetical protein [Clostridia bacterium]